jgi:hypothetical protein
VGFTAFFDERAGQQASGNLNYAPNRCQHLVVAARTDKLNHLVLGLQLLDFVQLGHFMKSNDSVRPMFKD